MSLIGIDLGTSFIKAGVLDLDTLQLKHVQRLPFPDPLTILAVSYREFDHASILNAVRKLLHEILPYAPNCQGVVMCTQMHGVVFTTAHGEARSNLTTWQDQRVLDIHPSGNGTYFDEMRDRLSLDEVRQLGNELRAGLPIGLFFWMAEQGKLPGPDVIPASLADFVVANLCKCRPVTDITNAMAHGLLNLDTMNWCHNVIEKLGLSDLTLPEIRSQGAVAGWLDWHGRKIPCYAPVGDYQCSIVGALLQDDELSLNISTGSQVSLLKPKAEFGEFQTRPFFDGRFTNTVTHIPAGRALNALLKLFSELAVSQGLELVDPWAYITHAAEQVSSPKLQANLAFYNSAIGDEGGLVHLREDELTIGHVFRAAFQSMGENYRMFADRLSPQKTWSRLVFSGGLVQKIDILRQIICDQFDADYRFSPAQEDSLLGLMALGLAYTGRTTSVSQAISLLSEAYRVGEAIPLQSPVS